MECESLRRRNPPVDSWGNETFLHSLCIKLVRKSHPQISHLRTYLPTTYFHSVYICILKLCNTHVSSKWALSLFLSIVQRYPLLSSLFLNHHHHPHRHDQIHLRRHTWTCTHNNNRHRMLNWIPLPAWIKIPKNSIIWRWSNALKYFPVSCSHSHGIHLWFRSVVRPAFIIVFYGDA